MQVADKIRIAITDDHPIYRQGIKSALTIKEDVDVIWEAKNGKEMISKIEEEAPDILVMDIRMPEMDGLMAIQIIRQQFEDIKIIVLTTYDDEKMISRMMEMGANAYLSKNTNIDEIYEAILTCKKEDIYFNSLVNHIPLNKSRQNKKGTRGMFGGLTAEFTQQELNILQLMADDKNAKDISKIVFLSPRTIEKIRFNMKSKANAKTISGLLVYGIKHHLIY